MTEPRTVVVRVSGHPPGGNDLHRMNRWGVTKSRDQWRSATFVLAYAAVLEQPGWTPLQRASLGVTWRFRVRRKRDLDNLIAGLKPMVDGLVDGGVLLDDHSGVLVSLGPFQVETGCEQDETVMTVAEEIP